MNQKKESNRKTNPRQDASIFSKITFWYTLPLFIKGFKGELKEEDLYAVLPELRSQNLGAKFEVELKKPKISVNLAFWNLIGKCYILLGLTKVVTIFLNVLRPIIIGNFVSYFVPEQTELSKADACFYGFILVGLGIMDILYRQNYYISVETLAIKLRAALSSVIYRKTLYLSAHRSNFGIITNLITRDVNTFDFFFCIFNDSWTEFISTVILCYNMYQRIGLAILVVVLGLGILIPCLVMVGFKMAALKTASCQKTDERIDILREVLCKIRSTKMYVWEKFVEKAVSEARKKEMKILFDMCVTMFFVLSFSMLTLHLTHYLVLMTCVWLGQPMTGETIYFVTSGFQSIYYNLTVAIPYATFMAAQASAALKRIQSVIELLNTNTRPFENYPNRSEIRIVKAKNLTLELDQKIIIGNLSFDIRKGLTLLMGHASSGKSLLLLTILKEFQVTKGSLLTNGRISYVSQDPWLFPSTIKENILFGAKYDEERYQKIIEVCALDYDFQMFEEGDETVIAEQGNNLSKGQQSRICLARAIYRESDIYLLDDCLSNLDPLVSNTIFKNCIMAYLKDKVVILVTNKSRLVLHANYVIKLINGKAEILKNCSPQNIIAGNLVLKSENINCHDVEKETNEKTKLVSQHKTKKVYKEIQETGAVPLRIYHQYINYGGGIYSLAIIFCLFFFGQLCISYKDTLISQWANLEDKIRNNSTPHELKYERNLTLYIYSATIVVIAATILLRVFSLFLFLRKASISIHKAMLKSVINASTNFFDHTFIGNIINRFSKDLVTTDESIPFTMLHLTATMGVLFLVSFVNVMLLIPTIIFFSSLIFLRRGYLKTGRALRRLEATTKIPIVGYINAALKGLPTIKTFQAQDILTEEFQKHQDLHTSASYSNLSCMRAFVFLVDSLILIFLTVIILKFLFFDKEANAGDVGLTVSQIVMLSMKLYYGFHKWAELETHMTSVERAFEYTTINQERKTGLVLEKWPKLGKIKFNNVFVSFDNCRSNVLNNLNFVIKPGEKVGVVGRTGAGKSTIISVLFRLYDFEGNIEIDNTNIKTLSLEFLRSKISVIPQDSLILSGTFRNNIDPERKHTDQEIWKVLEGTKLKHIFPSLDIEIVESELSFAQKQLICVARVLLTKNQILLLDEVTESGDSDTENLIDDLVEQHFKLSTVIRVTHQMKFAMKCDRVLVIDKGKIVELDSPWKLYQDKSSLFFKMVYNSDFTVK